MHTAAVYLRLEVLPSTHEILRMREDVGRALGRHVFLGYRFLRPVLRAAGRFAIALRGSRRAGHVPRRRQGALAERARRW